MHIIANLVDDKVHSIIDNHPTALGVIALISVWGFTLFIYLTC